VEFKHLGGGTRHRRTRQCVGARRPLLRYHQFLGTEHDGAGEEWITLDYTFAVYATRVAIRETDGGGFVTKIEQIDVSDALHTVWSGIETNPGVVYDFVTSFAQTSYLVDGVKITIDTTISGGWDEIDAVKLTGSDAAACTGVDCASVPIPASITLLGFGLTGLRINMRRRSSRALKESILN